MTIEVEGVEHKNLPGEGIEEICKEKVVEDDDLKNGELKPIDGVPIADEDKIEKEGPKDGEPEEEAEAPREEILTVEGEEPVKQQQSRLAKIVPGRFWERWFRKGEPAPEAGGVPVEETEMADRQQEGKEPQEIEEKAEDSCDGKQEDDTKNEKEEKSSSSTELTIPIGDTENSDEQKQPEGDGSPEKAALRDRIAMYRSKGYILAGVAVGLLVLVTIILVGTALTGNGLSFEEEWSAPIAVTECGPVEGHLEDGVYVFRGIPYALPPTGDRRWKPPQPFQKLEDCWTGTRQVHEFGNQCYQRELPGLKLNVSEDCLIVNVYTPSLSRRRLRPVVVYIPGGSLMGIDEMDLALLPTPKLSRDRDVVFVTFNFRRNAFGFVALDPLSKSAHPPTSGNYGLLDQVAALKWVQRNIQQFNGDPNKVTLLGHGAGATSALLLMASELSQGLFSKIWATGPAVNFSNKTSSEAYAYNEGILRSLGCDTATCLRQKAPEEVLSAVPDSWYRSQFHDLPSSDEEDFPGLTSVDGYFLKSAVNELWHSGEYGRVPIVLGSNLHEYGSEEVPPGRRITNPSEASKYVREKLGSIDGRLAEEALELYAKNGTSPNGQLHTMISDVRVTCPLRVLTRDLLNSTGAGAHFYVVDHVPSSPLALSSRSKGTKLSVHGLDVVAILGQLEDHLPNATRSDRQFQHNLQELFYTFVHTGTPALGSQPLGESPSTNYVGESVRTRSSPHESCELWERYGAFPKYARRD